MRNLSTPSEKLFLEVADELTRTFPGLDLRFTLRENSEQIRLRAPTLSEDVAEIELRASTEETLYEAVFAVKELGRLFDA